MLQQTQTSRVVGPWTSFLERFPTPGDCADAPLSEVLRAWEGLGFHRRAKFLHEAAVMITRDFGGVVPATVVELRQLPGVGSYTANAIASFAFGHPVAVLDTNVGRILARAVANERLSPADAQRRADELRGSSDSRQFNQAMLDLGAQFCTSRPACETCPVSRHCRWRQEGGDDPAVLSGGVSKKQSTFAGSDRQLRGRILATLRTSATSYADLLANAGTDDDERVQRILQGLLADGLVEARGARWHLAGEVAR
jgi:A/G-specific adenine glycosylase